MECLHYLAAEVQDTCALADSLAPQLGPGDVVLLDGPLGSGKTAFVQALARALDYHEPVTSPTFTVANFYSSPALTLLHIDAYRLEGVTEFRDLGLTDYLEECCSVIEWGERVAEEFDDSLRVDIAFGSESETVRKFTVAGEGPRWAAKIRQAAATIHQVRGGPLRLVTQ
jgi:tRNA threonylcarbamoyladenosine biosynthesis protein TsaE